MEKGFESRGFRLCTPKAWSWISSPTSRTSRLSLTRELFLFLPLNHLLSTCILHVHITISIFPSLSLAAFLCSPNFAAMFIIAACRGIAYDIHQSIGFRNATTDTARAIVAVVGAAHNNVDDNASPFSDRPRPHSLLSSPRIESRDVSPLNIVALSGLLLIVTIRIDSSASFSLALNRRTERRRFRVFRQRERLLVANARISSDRLTIDNTADPDRLHPGTSSY